MRSWLPLTIRGRPSNRPRAPATIAHSLVERGGSSVVARGAGGHWPLGLGRVAEVRWLRTGRRCGIASCRLPSQWLVTGRFHGDSDRQVLAETASLPIEKAAIHPRGRTLAGVLWKHAAVSGARVF